jgi:hypothetical protein
MASFFKKLFGSGGSNEMKQVDNWNADQKALAADYGQGLRTAFQGAQGTLNGILAGNPSSQINSDTTKNYFQGSIYNPAKQQFQQQVMPQINETMGGNYWSSARQNAQQNAYQDFNNSMNSQLQNLLYQDKQKEYELNESAQNRALQGMGLLNSYLQLNPYQNYQSQSGGSMGLLGGITTAANALGATKAALGF